MTNNTTTVFKNNANREDRENTILINKNHSFYFDHSETITIYIINDGKVAIEWLDFDHLITVLRTFAMFNV